MILNEEWVAEEPATEQQKTRREREVGISSQKLSRLFPGYVFINEVKDRITRTYLALRTTDATNCLIEVYNVSKLAPEKLRFYTRELEKVKELRHPNIDPLEDFWLYQNFLFIVTTKKSSRSLAKYIEKGRLSFKQYLEVSIQLTGAIEALHQKKVYHGGLMPANISISTTQYVSIDTPLLYRLKVDLGEIPEDDPSLKNFIDLSINPLNASYIDVDIASLGALACFLATGYPPHRMHANKWEHYGLSTELQTIVHKCIGTFGFKEYSNVSEVVDSLEALQLEKCTVHDVSKPCLQTRFYRKKYAQTYLLDGDLKFTSEQGAADELYLQDDYEKYVFCNKPAKDLLFDQRYELLECVQLDELGASFSAIDHKCGDQRVWLHLFENPQDEKWAKEYKALARKLQRLSHQHIAEITHWQLLKDVGYIVNKQEDGIRIGEFLKKHRLSYPEIIDFALQMTSAFDMCVNNDIQCYKLSFNDIVVYQREDGSFLYRIITVGHSSILHLTHHDKDQIDWLTSSETRPPEAYEGILRGIQTTQYILSQIIYKAVMGSHPCEGMSLEEARDFHQTIKRINFGNYQNDIPVEFQQFYRRISSPLIERRYTCSAEMHEALVKVAQC